jgi:hypothetical protein
MTGQIEDSEREADDVAAEVQFISAERLIFSEPATCSGQRCLPPAGWMTMRDC